MMNGTPREDGQALCLLRELADALSTADDEPTARGVVASWLERVLHGARVVFLEAKADPFGAPPRDDGDGLVVTASGERISYAVHLSHDGDALRVDLPSALEATAPETRALLRIASSMLIAAVARVRTVPGALASGRAPAAPVASAFLGASGDARRVATLLPRIARSAAPVLLTGESGTGKTFVAALLHEASLQRVAPFRVVNCAAVPPSLLESELFGHERGAFTGATASRVGAFESAADGTIFLDEIGDLTLVSQAKLLRVLEERRFERIGSNRSLTMRARLIVATNRNLGRMVLEGSFRADLFYRISVVRLEVPALRARGEDVVLLAERLLAGAAQRAGRSFTGFTRGALEAMRSYAWPGNVRELRNAVDAALVLGRGPLVALEDLPPELRSGGSRSDDDGSVVRLPASLKVIEKRAIDAALRAANGNRNHAAAILGINRVTLYKKLRHGDNAESESIARQSAAPDGKRSL